MSAWDHTAWGSAKDPIHKSDLNKVVGKFGCLSQFQRGKDELATGERVYEEANGKICAGNAAHTVLHRLCKSPAAMAVVLGDTGANISEHGLTMAFDAEFDKEVAGRPVSWFKAKPEKHRDDCLEMIFGAVRGMREHVAEVVLAEAGFIYELGGHWLTGSIDLVYRPRSNPNTLAMCDWKTGAQKPHQIELDHGFEAGIYGNAIKSGWFIPYDNVPDEPGRSHRLRMEDACIELAVALDADDETDVGYCLSVYGAQRFDEYPEEIRHVHLRDFVPYQRKSAPTMRRPEELAWAGMTEPGKLPREKGDARGPGWYHVRRSDADTPRLRSLLDAIVQWVRLGHFPSAPGEMCSRCRFREPCLLSGYERVGDEKRRLEQMMGDDSDGVDFDY